jgi:hypothetical protein
MKKLTVTNPFDGFELGEIITDKETIERVLASENSSHVVSTNLEEVTE